MLRALQPSMRSAILLLSVLAAAGCRDRSAMVEGVLLEPGDATWVWAAGGAERQRVDDGAFALDGIRGDTLDLRFATDDEEVGWMRIVGLPAGGRIALDGIWFDDDRAFPTSVDLGRGGVVSINGLRMSPPGQLRGSVELPATLLALDRSAGVLLARPDDESLADVRVVLPPGVSIRGEDGEPVPLSRMDFGDPFTVRGSVEGGYLIATEVVTPRSLSGGADPGSSGSASDADRTSPSLVAPPPSQTPSRPADRPSVRDRDEDDDDDSVRPRDGRGPDGRGPPGQRRRGRNR
jgi:hypothetical protein